MQAISLGPRRATEIVDAAFRLCRAHYGPLVTATAVIVGPALILKLLLPFEVVGIADLLENLLLPVSDGAAIAIVSEVYLGRTADAGTGLRAVRGRVGSLVLSSIARNVLIGLGLVLLIVPGVFLFVGTFAVPMAIVLEGRKTGAAFTRARELVEEHLGHALGTLALLVVIVGALMIGLRLVLGGAGGLIGIEGRSIDLLWDVGLILLYPLFSVGGTLLYYDLRIRREGFDLEMMAQDLAGGTPRDASASVATPPAIG